MKSTKIIFALALLSSHAFADEIPLFDGKSLKGWKGNTTFWKVEDGAITAESTAEHSCTKTTYLRYTGKQFSDFELTLSFRFLSKQGNSGIQYRSQASKDSFAIKGYQADLETGTNYSGILYDQDGRGIVAKRGQKMRISPDGKKQTEPLPSGELAQKSIKPGEWNSYKIVADGNKLMHFINGHKTVEVIDEDKKHKDAKGWIALQLHQGPAMKVQFKDLMMLELDHDKNDKPETITTLPGFQTEKLYTVPKEQGSWVSMTFDEAGNLYTCDQHGALYRILLENGKIGKVEQLESPGMAQGLCWANDSLYMGVSMKNPGVYRLTDTNKDGKLDKQELLFKLKSGGEHGLHAIVQSPTGELYYSAGNHTPLPAGATSPSNGNWQEDHLLTRLLDPRGHATQIKAPGGHIVRFGADGSNPEIIATGFRNAYDIAFTPQGELFAYDSDMEWDAGTPWYRPTRVMHVTTGAEYGWRTGTSKWPAYFADSLPAMIDIGPGSPTGVLFGTQAAFPQKYRDALFILDWTFGRIYALHLSPQGSSYTATKEEFISGKPLPLTDATIGPDGAMYFLTGGRRLASSLYRISYTGKLSESPSILERPPLASLTDTLTKSPNLDTVWKHLDHSDRRVSYHARLALEGIPLKDWIIQYRSETNPYKVIHASIALARLGKNGDTLLEKLNTLPFDELDRENKLSYLRALSLAYIRNSLPVDSPASIKTRILLEKSFPTDDFASNVELARLLIKLRSTDGLNKTLTLMETSVNEAQDIDQNLIKGNDRYGKDFEKMLANQPNAKGIQFALILMSAEQGWNQATTTRYFQWLYEAELRDGGASYKGFIKNIQKEALKRFSPELQQSIAKLPRPKAKKEPVYVAKGPGQAWTLQTALTASQDLSKASYENGRKMFHATLCIRCHTHGNAGGDSGPNLTNLSTRFNKEDILKAIIDPSAEVSEQYHFQQITMKDGTNLFGKVLSRDDQQTVIATTAFDLQQTTTIDSSKIQSVAPSTTSPMPPALIYSLNPDELRDLMKFLTTGKE
ncbi:hypothetical protein Rhal01_02213 [Rubritalea halochordaticola]|uniref:DUF1080 domain-containing protein n=1 Tax=Rubritalea halochordaticola TaxID=714537 RepID=A0ABP9V054_9BACT